MPAWKATPAPPIGPILWQHGINIGAFVKEFNDKTMETMQAYWGTQVKVPVNIKVYIDRSYDMEILPPVTSSCNISCLCDKVSLSTPCPDIRLSSPFSVCELYVNFSAFHQSYC